jgi:hypothetical protein
MLLSNLGTTGAILAPAALGTTGAILAPAALGTAGLLTVAATFRLATGHVRRGFEALGQEFQAATFQNLGMAVASTQRREDTGHDPPISSGHAFASTSSDAVRTRGGTIANAIGRVTTSQVKSRLSVPFLRLGRDLLSRHNLPAVQ